MLLPEKSVLVGQRQVHAGVLHRRQCLDRAGQLPFESTLKRQTLLELGHAKSVGLHHLETGHRALGQTHRGQPQPGVMHLVSWHQNGTTPLGVLVGDIHLGQLGHYGAAVLVGQVGVEHPPIGLAPHEQAQTTHYHKQRDAQHQAQALGRRKAGESLVDGRVEDDCRGAGHLVFRFLLARCGSSSGRNY